ncbi:hypothetical protein PQR63_19465 [Herbaspirillum rhizosphaerae]|uniref:PD-(D/E)XK nuclease superfamily protein n=1 Tax=Herbaspirillum rhizosphaerae TaxID=346179 RepID=A0ABW8ZBQ8_9BURK
MLTIFYPEIAQMVLQYPAGIRGFQIPGEAVPSLIVKMLQQYLLTAKMNQGFKVYIVPLDVAGIQTIGLMTAFFEDAESPLTVWTPLSNDATSKSIIATLLGSQLKVHLFDEHDRELLGYEATVHISPEAKRTLNDAKLYDLAHDVVHELAEAATIWFATRTEQHDAEAIAIKFDKPIFPEETVIMDMNPERYSFHGGQGFNRSVLVKTEPGYFQEIDIILLLQRVLSVDQIYHAPKRVYDGEEIADIIVITDDICLLIQAKDSQNTEEILKNTLERKRSRAVKQLKGGIAQAKGAIGYLERIQPLRMLIDDKEIEIDLGRRQILSLIVVREFFTDSYSEYSEHLFGLFKKIDLPCIALDYAELHNWTSFCEDVDEFSRAYFEVFNFALEHGEYPRLRFGMRDLYRKDGSFKFDER